MRHYFEDRIITSTLQLIISIFRGRLGLKGNRRGGDGGKCGIVDGEDK